MKKIFKRTSMVGLGLMLMAFSITSVWAYNIPQGVSGYFEAGYDKVYYSEKYDNNSCKATFSMDCPSNMAELEISGKLYTPTGGWFNVSKYGYDSYGISTSRSYEYGFGGAEITWWACCDYEYINSVNTNTYK